MPAAAPEPTVRALHLVSRGAPPLPRPARRVILVAGMSRSGTSLTTRLLGLAGATVPEELLGAGHGNPAGHWEPRDLVEANEATLAALQRSWHDTAPVPAEWFGSRAAYPHLERLVAVIARCTGDATLSVLKDPRIGTLLPLYLTACDVLDIEPLIVLQVRPPAEVIRSLWVRDRIDPRSAELLWLRSVLDSERHSRSRRRVWISMEAMLADWTSALARAASAFRIEWPLDPRELSAEAARIVKPGLVHAAAAAELVPPLPGVLAQWAWRAVSHALAGEEERAAEQLTSLGHLLADIDRLQAPERAEYEADRLALVATRASRSWRATAPLRRLNGILHRMR